MQGEVKSKSTCTIFLTFQETNFVVTFWSIYEESNKMVENPLPKLTYLFYSWEYFKNMELVDRYNQVFEDEILRIRVMDIFPKWTNWWNNPKRCKLDIIIIQWILCIMRVSWSWDIIQRRGLSLEEVFFERRKFALSCMASSFSMQRFSTSCMHSNLQRDQDRGTLVISTRKQISRGSMQNNKNISTQIFYYMLLRSICFWMVAL